VSSTPSSATSSNSTSLDRNALVGFNFLDRLFKYFDKKQKGYLLFQDIVDGIGEIKFGGLMSNIDMLFHVHDTGHKGYLSREDIILVGESLLFLCRKMESDQYLNAVSDLMKEAFELEVELKEEKKKREEILKTEEKTKETTTKVDEENESSKVISSNNSSLNNSTSTDTDEVQFPLSTFRVLIMSNPFFVQYFTDFENTINMDMNITANVEGVKTEILELIWNEGVKWAKKRVQTGNSNGGSGNNNNNNKSSSSSKSVTSKSSKANLSPTDNSGGLSPPPTLIRKNSRQDITYTFSNAEEEDDNEEADSMKKLLDNMDMTTTEENIITPPDNVNNLFNPFN
jgi:hypothetical protein